MIGHAVIAPDRSTGPLGTERPAGRPGVAPPGDGLRGWLGDAPQGRPGDAPRDRPGDARVAR